MGRVCFPSRWPWHLDLGFPCRPPWTTRWCGSRASCHRTSAGARLQARATRSTLGETGLWAANRTASDLRSSARHAAPRRRARLGQPAFSTPWLAPWFTWLSLWSIWPERISTRYAPWFTWLECSAGWQARASISRARRTATSRSRRAAVGNYFFPGIVHEFSRMLLRPTPLQQQSLVSPAARSGPLEAGLLDFDTLELGLRRQRARLPSKIFHPVCEGL